MWEHERSVTESEAASGPRASSATARIRESRELRLSTSVIWAYCLPMVSLQFMGMLFGIYLMKFATDVLLVAPGAMGLLFLIGRGWDAVSDPVAGYLSDRSTARRGRRRSWMVASALPILVTTVMLWSPPSFVEGTAGQITESSIYFQWLSVRR